MPFFNEIWYIAPIPVQYITVTNHKTATLVSYQIYKNYTDHDLPVAQV